MAVQQNRKTRAKRGMRRAHDALTVANISVDESGKLIYVITSPLTVIIVVVRL